MAAPAKQPPQRRRQAAVLLALGIVAALGAIAWLGAGGYLPRPGGPASMLHLDPPELALGALEIDEGVPVLCYHYFRPAFDPAYLARVVGAVVLNLPTLGYREFWTTPIGEFERHLRWFRDHDVRVMTLDEVAAAGAAGALPERAVVLTIDDADRSVYELAWPALRRHGVRAHLFVPTAKVGGPWSGLHVCDWEQLREMSESGTLVIGSHSHDLHWKLPTDRGWQPAFYFPERLAGGARGARSAAAVANAAGALGGLAAPALAGALPADSLGAADAAVWIAGGRYRPVAEDLRRSWRAIADGTGRPPRYLAWPYGFASSALDSIAAAAGFAGTLSLKPYPYDGQIAPWHIGRFAVTAKTTVADLDALLDREE